MINEKTYELYIEELEYLFDKENLTKEQLERRTLLVNAIIEYESTLWFDEPLSEEEFNNLKKEF